MAKGKSTTKVKKKKWFTVNAPELFNRELLGETTAYEPEEITGRHMIINLMELTHDIKKQHVNMDFKVTGFVDNTGVTEIRSYEIIPASLKRQIRRKRDKIDDSFVCRTKDDKIIRIKPFILTANNASAAIRTALRKRARDVMYSITAKNTFEQIIQDLISQKLQFFLRDSLKSIYPLKYCDIRYLGLDEKAKVPKIQAETLLLEEKKKAEAKPEEDSEEQPATEESTEEQPIAEETEEEE